MTTHPRDPGFASAPTREPPVPSPARRIGQEHTLSAFERLITTGNPKIGARRLLENAARHGINPDMLWGVVAGAGRPDAFVRQVCMVVPGAGGTGMCFLSSPTRDTRMGDRATQIGEIGAALGSALDDLRRDDEHGVRLAQCLIETDQTWARRACEDAGMTSVGTLEYLRLAFGEIRAMTPPTDPWPEGVTIRRVREMSGPESDLGALRTALERSYEGTMDCPELCGLRGVDDVIESHLATGVFDPSRWWLLFVDGEPEGCCLLSHCPASESVELVYLGIGVSARGKGLGKRLLVHALGALRIDGVVHEVTCAVDRRNTPASRAYRDLGFRRFDARMGYVKRVR